MNLYAFSIVAGVLATLLWGYLLIARGSFWQVRRSFAPTAGMEEAAGPIAVIIPARNEERVIAQSIHSLLQQTCTQSMHIFVVDDASIDRTKDVAEDAARQAGELARLTILNSTPLPEGWTGKLWAVHQGIERASDLHPKFLLLTDADIVHGPTSIVNLVSLAESGRYDLTSFMPKLHCQTLAEKILVPAFVFFFFKLYPPAWIADPRRDVAGAAGGCMLVRYSALEHTGGIYSIRNQIIDDCALAQVIKRSGGRLWLGLSSDTLSIRGYGSSSEIGSTISRTAFSQLHHSSVILLAALCGMAMTYVLPAALLFSGYLVPVTFGAVAWLMMTIAYVPMIRFYRLHTLWAALLPLAALFYMGATIHSTLRYWSGRGGEWKGRVQDHIGLYEIERPRPKLRRT
jgi:hopene-associated glycosyltransferase HpnB